jgi:multiple sugar transport system substrate-binding protein
VVDRFNQENKEGITVEYREMPADTGQYFDQVRTEFQAGAENIDIIGADVIWPAQFAAQGWILDLSGRFPRSEQNKFLEAPMEAGIWDELKEMAQKVQQDQGTKYGFVFQGADYEGGVCNELEYIWTHGGDVLDPNDPNKVIIGTPESAAEHDRGRRSAAIRGQLQGAGVPGHLP